MKKVIYAKDYQKELMELLKEHNIKKDRGFALEHMEQSIKANSKLKYDVNKGITYQGREKVSWYSYESDIDKDITIDEVLEYQFLGWILNSCSRLQRGYSA